MLLSIALQALQALKSCWLSVCRQALQQSESFSPQVDAHSMKLAEAVYEQTRALGPTPLQGRLNYLHQLGKITLRDRSNSLLSLPQQREDIEVAVGHMSDSSPCAPATFDTGLYAIDLTCLFTTLQSDAFHHYYVIIVSTCTLSYMRILFVFWIW